MPVRVKICGITSVEDAREAVAAGADALGFMFYRPSPRFIEPAQVRAIVETLPPFVSRVGVFVDASLEDIRRQVRECGLDTIQLHGAESPAFCGELKPAPIVKAFRIRSREALADLPAYGDCAWLLDSFVAGTLGGTGHRFNWDWAVEAVAMTDRLILAGGLTPENIGEAVGTVRPYGVDVSSGVESSPGRKDPAKVRAFVAAAKSA